MGHGGGQLKGIVVFVERGLYHGKFVWGGCLGRLFGEVVWGGCIETFALKVVFNNKTLSRVFRVRV